MCLSIAPAVPLPVQSLAPQEEAARPAPLHEPEKRSVEVHVPYAVEDEVSAVDFSIIGDSFRYDTTAARVLCS